MRIVLAIPSKTDSGYIVWENEEFQEGEDIPEELLDASKSLICTRDHIHEDVYLLYYKAKCLKELIGWTGEILRLKSDTTGALIGVTIYRQDLYG